MNRAKITNEEWSKAKRQFHLDDEELWMAKKLRLTPEIIRRKLARSGSEEWKDVVPLRIRRLFDRRFGMRSKG